MYRTSHSRDRVRYLSSKRNGDNLCYHCTQMSSTTLDRGSCGRCSVEPGTQNTLGNIDGTLNRDSTNADGVTYVNDTHMLNEEGYSIYVKF
jgi:hypothetical protein